jgi:hypothetical protein
MGEVKKTELMLMVETFLDKDLEEYLREKYDKDEMTFEEIVEDVKKKTRLQLNPATISRWFKKFNIKPRILRWVREDETAREAEKEYERRRNAEDS